MHKRYKRYFFSGIIIVLALVLSRFSHSDFKEKKLSKINLIPTEDRSFFLSHFRRLLTSDLGFTLIGSKPLALEEFSYQEMAADPSKKQKLIRYLQLIFKDSMRFTLSIGDCPEGIMYDAYLIDNAAFRELKEDPNQEFVFETEKIGKLFGYGKENAQFYLRYLEVAKYLRKTPIVYSLFVTALPVSPHTPVWFKLNQRFNETAIPSKVTVPSANSHFTSLEEEWKWLSQNRNPYPEWDIPPMWIRKPGYMSKKGPETDALDRHYEEAANRLGELLHDEHWFDRLMAIIDGTSPEASNLTLPPLLE